MLLTLYLPLLLAAYLGAKLYVPLAKKAGWLDAPDVSRKFQECKIPVGAGWCVVLPFVVATSAAAFFVSTSGKDFINVAYANLAVLFCAWLGFQDDRRPLSGGVKLVQLLFPALAIALTRFNPFQTPIELLYSCPLRGVFLFKLCGVFGLAFLVLWILTFVNSFNLLDGADGFATTFAIMYAASLGFVVSYWPEPTLALNAVFANWALVAAALGFLVVNLPPAKAYLGDAGSLSIGMILAALSFNVFSYESILRPIPVFALMTLPLMDSVFAILRRISLGRSVFEPDRDHLHHQLQDRFGQGYPPLIALILLQLPLSASAVFGYATDYDLAPLVAGCLYWPILPAFNVFGRNDVRVFFARLNAFCVKRFRPDAFDRNGAFLQYSGAKDDSVWLRLLDAAKAKEARALVFKFYSPAEKRAELGFWNAKGSTQNARAYRVANERTAKDGSVCKIVLQYDPNKLDLAQAQKFADDLFDLYEKSTNFNAFDVYDEEDIEKAADERDNERRSEDNKLDNKLLEKSSDIILDETSSETTANSERPTNAEKTPNPDNVNNESDAL